MGFLTPALLAGCALGAIPLVLHLMMRRQPQKLPFPALQFVQARHESNQRRVKFRHLLLLALRLALLCGLAFALARPTLRGSDKQGAPLAVALVFDNSPRMQYIQQQQSRLEQAKEMGANLIDQLPAETVVAVLARDRGSSRYLTDPSTAKTKLQSLSLNNHPKSLGDTLRVALEMVQSHKECRQEVVVFSDLTRMSFTDSTLNQIAASLQEAPEVDLYLVDVGCETPHNYLLGDLKLRSETITPGDSLHVEVDLQSTALASAQKDSPLLVELYLKDSQGGQVKRGQQWYHPKTPDNLVFELADLTLGTQQGSITLATSDPLLMDNIRYFTVKVQAPRRVLLAGKTRRQTLFVREALCPSLWEESPQEPTLPQKNRIEDPPTDLAEASKSSDLHSGRFFCETITFDQLSQTSLESYQAVGILDPPALPESVWQNLADFAEQGGGVGIFLGHLANRQSFNRDTSAAHTLLPGKLLRRSRDITYFRPQALDHPAFKELAHYAADIPWSIYPVLQFWELDSLADDTRVIARFANNQPALLGRLVNQGRVLTMTTPLSDPGEMQDREPWNHLPTGPEPWPFVLLAGDLFGFLSQETNLRTMFQAGETISVPLASQQQVSSYVLQQPEGPPIRQTNLSGQDTIRISTADSLGNYRLIAGGKSRHLDRGFSINATKESSSLERVNPQEMLMLLPSDRTHLSRDLIPIEEDFERGRTGQDLFPWAILLVVLVWGTEHVLANQFYRNSS